MSQPALSLAERLNETQTRIVLAESCTAGLAAATLASIPGISEWLYGSAVVYREATKISWLKVSTQDLEAFSAVSEPVAQQMATGVLGITPEADLSGAITGHLGPEAPDGLDGVVFIATACRDEHGAISVKVDRHQLITGSRGERQAEAAELLLSTVDAAVAKR